jgi:CTP:molybdopterin cytidylyltransferase MocA
MVDALTVVIPCKDDPLVERCLASIDEPLDVVVAFNGSPAGFADRVMARAHDGLRVHRVDLSEANLAAALEVGIAAAPTRRVLLMDSDCTFRAGSLAATANAMDTGDTADEVYKGTVVFARSRGWLARPIAQSRAHYTADVLTAFKPPLAFAVDLRARLGGYFFDERLHWKEDADLDCRVRAAGVRIVGVPDCVIDHSPVTALGDFRSNYRYGVGSAIAEHLSISVTQPDRAPKDAARRYGAGTAAYLWTVNRAKQAGYHVTRHRLRRSTR